MQTLSFQKQNKTALIRFDKRRIRSLCRMNYFGNEEVREEVVIRQGLRCAIVRVTNGMMTAHKGVWSWTAQEVH